MHVEVEGHRLVDIDEISTKMLGEVVSWARSPPKGNYK